MTWTRYKRQRTEAKEENEGGTAYGETNFVPFADFYYDCYPTNGAPAGVLNKKPPRSDA